MRHPTRLELIALAAFTLAVLVGAASIAGITVPSVYAKETASWAAQGMGQDWIDLCVVVPVVALCGVAIRGGSRRALLVLAGALIYLLYSFLLYAFAMHFNVLFLVYCATLGLSFYTLLGIAAYLHEHHAVGWFGDRVPLRRFGATFLIGTAVVFAGLWLSVVIPSLIKGEPPRDLEEAGLITNPVYVLDLALVLPGMLATGVLLLRKRGPGALLAPIAAAFNVLMTAALIGMIVAMYVRGVSTDLTVAAAMGVLSVISAIVLIGFLRPLHAPRPAL